MTLPSGEMTTITITTLRKMVKAIENSVNFDYLIVLFHFCREKGHCNYKCGKDKTCQREYECLLIYAKFFNNNSAVPTFSNISTNKDDYVLVYKNEETYDRRLVYIFIHLPYFSSH